MVTRVLLPAWQLNFDPLQLLTMDYETQSEVELVGKNSVGAFVYAEHPSTRVVCMAYTFEGEETKIWRPRIKDPFPERVLFHVANGGKVEAHNAEFEFCIWNITLARQLGFPVDLELIRKAVAA